MAGDGVWDRYTWGTEPANRTRYYDTKLGSEAVTNKVQNRSRFGREDDETIKCFFLNCNIASLLMDDRKFDPKFICYLEFTERHSLWLRDYLRLGMMGASKEGLEVFTEFFWRNDTHYLVVEFFKIVNIIDIPRRDDHPRAKPSIYP